MATSNSNIALGGQVTPLANPMDVYLKGLQLQQMQQQGEHARMAMDTEKENVRQAKTLADLYRGAVKGDGSIDRNALFSGAAAQGLGAKIPGLQKSFADADKEVAGVDETKAKTAKTQQEILHNGLQQTGATISSLLADPLVDDNKVMAEMGRLVRIGAFDAQAAHTKKTADQYAQELISTMPVGRPDQLRRWLVQQGMQAMDASKRVELLLPKRDEQDRGGVINEGTVDQLTGQRTSGVDIAKTLTPGEVQSGVNQRRGQDLTYTAATRANDIAKEAGQSQVVETPQGYAVINKGAADARPVRMDTGQPVLGKDSTVAKNATMARNITNIIPYARELLGKGPTASGIGAKTDALAGTLGIQLNSKDVAGQLDTLGGWMTSNVPRFEGPQGVQDVIIYQQMAGTVGDRTKSISERKKALDTVEKLMQNYSGAAGTAPATPIAPRAPVPTRGTSSPMGRGTPAPVAPTQTAPSGQPDINSFFR